MRRLNWSRCAVARKRTVVNGIEGAADLSARLDRMEDGARGATLVEAVRDAARPIQQTASRLAPRKTGKLSRNIDIAVEVARPTRAAADIGPNASAWYGRLVETGTKHASAKPFLRPAFDTEKNAAVAALRASLRSALGFRG